MPEVAFLNGEFMPIDEATVPIEDRGLQFADGVYEVVATYGGQPYAMPAHLQRLERSLAELRIELDIRNYGLEGVIAGAIRRSGYADAMVYIQITRGVASRHHEFPQPAVTPTVIVTVKALEHIPSEIYEAGVEDLFFWDGDTGRANFRTSFSALRRLGHREEIASWAMAGEKPLSAPRVTLRRLGDWDLSYDTPG